MGGNSSAAPAVVEGDRLLEISISEIVASPFQPRKGFEQERLQELSDSIKQHGVLQPLVVRKSGGKYELIAGERRFRASQLAGLEKVPVILRNAADQQALEEALIENLQRVDLDPLEEADGYAHLMEAFKLTQEQVAQKVGKNRVTVANALRLRNLNAEVRSLLQQGHISVGHAKVLLSLTDETLQMQAAKEVVRQGLNVRQTEALVASFAKQPTASKGKSGVSASKGVEWRDMEQKFQRALGTRVSIHGSHDKGTIEIKYFSGDDFDRVLSKLGIDPNA